MTLEGLPLDLLRPVTNLLDARDVQRLWMTGSKTLMTAMRCGGVERLAASGSRWPRLAAHLRLLSFEHCANTLYTCTHAFVVGVDLLAFSATLQILRLKFPTALSRLLQLPDGTSPATLWPNLKELTLSPQFIPKFSQEAFVKSLPASLTKLKFPDNVCFPMDSLLCLPCTRLEMLQVSVGSIRTGDDEDRFRSAAVFAHLNKLTLVAHNDVRLFRLVPASVEVLKCWNSPPQEEGNFVFGTTLSRRRIERYLPSIADFSALPRHLTILRGITAELPGTPELVEALPKTLTWFSWIDLFAACNMDEPSTILPLIKQLPRCLQYLDSETMSLSLTVFKEIFPHLPTTLKEWGGLNIHRDEGTEHDEIDAFRGLTLPNKLRTLAVDETTLSVISALPPTLTSFESSGRLNLPPYGFANFAIRVPHLVVLVLELGSMKASDFLRLPPQIRSLRWTVRNVERLETLHGHWAEVWPPRLEHLTFAYFSVYGVGLVSDDFWTAFPTTLLDLRLRLFGVQNFPSSLGFLPRSLRNASLHITNAEQVLDDAFFSSVPPSLTSLHLQGFLYNCTHAVLARLPAELRMLHLERRQRSSRMEERIFDFGASAPSPDLWNVLDRIPRFVTFHVSGLSPDFTSWIRQRQLDDLAEECPNTSFDSHPPGQGRPNSTPRRLEFHNV